MEVRVHHDPQEFWSLVRPVFAADPMLHTIGLSAVRRLVEAPDSGDEPPVLLSLWEDGRIGGATFRTPPWPMGVSALPASADKAVAATLLDIDVDLPGVTGPRETAERFAAMWSDLAGVTVTERLAMRLYRLGTLEPPVVPGRARLATEDDIPLMAGWRRDFELETMGAQREPGSEESSVRRAMKMRSGLVLWEVEGLVVSYAAAGAPIDGMSRVGPVYTPPDQRGHGYGSAVTAAVSQWAVDAGAEHVVLFTDLANPVSNSIYQRIGYRPRYDQAELEFAK
jgi:RimJ/RimL family protein N-acetyltransferase